MSDHDLPCGHSAKYAIFGGDNGCLACSAERLASERDALVARLAEAVDLFAEPEIIEETFGPRCSEYEPGCPCCRAWKWLDDNRTPDSALLGKGKP